jgi:hypothetical protein
MEWTDLNCGSYSHEITMNKKLNKLTNTGAYHKYHLLF